MKLAIFPVLMMYVGCSYASNSECLNFVTDMKSNKVQEFLLAEKITEKERDGLVVYSAAHDLNGDNSPEYFYLLKSFDFCGMNNWCSIDFYTKQDSEFKRIKNNGVIVHDLSKINGVICLGNNIKDGWTDLVVNGHLTIKYTDGLYK